MKAKIICVEAIVYLLLYNLHDCTFKFTYSQGTLTKIKEFGNSQESCY